MRISGRLASWSSQAVMYSDVAVLEAKVERRRDRCVSDGYRGKVGYYGQRASVSREKGRVQIKYRQRGLTSCTRWNQYEWQMQKGVDGRTGERQNGGR